MPERRGEREGIGVLAPKPEILAPLLVAFKAAYEMNSVINEISVSKLYN